LQHPTSGKRVIKVQFIDPPHQSQIAVRHWTWRVINAATAEAEKLGLAHDGEFVRSVDHFFPPSNPALPSAPDIVAETRGSAKHRSPVSVHQSPHKHSLSRGTKRFHIDCGFRFGFTAENARRSLKKMVLPLLDLIGAHVELLG
jgi:hypothetical protein